ncbi:hypothetical protein Tco_0367390 [Tanacetum coccineum]
MLPRSRCAHGTWLLYNHKRLSATDISAHASMKNVAKCDTWCELQNPVNHRVFERKLRLKPFGRGHVCLGVTHRVAPNKSLLGADIGLPMTLRPRPQSGEASSATDRAQVPWKGAPERVRAPSCPDPVAPRGAAKYWRETDSKQVPRGKDEKDFEKRVKECLKLSGGKRMGAGDASRSDVERRICFSCRVSDSTLSLCHRINKPCWRVCLAASLAGAKDEEPCFFWRLDPTMMLPCLWFIAFYARLIYVMVTDLPQIVACGMFSDLFLRGVNHDVVSLIHLVEGMIEEEDEEKIRFLGGNSSSGTKKKEKNLSEDQIEMNGGHNRGWSQIAGEVIGSGDEIVEFSEELKDMLYAEASK